MELNISERAVSLYKQEMQLDTNDVLTLFLRVGGVGSGGFSAGITKGYPEVDYIKFNKSDVIFCVAQDETWYFNGMSIDYDEDRQEVNFTNPYIEDVVNPK